MRASSRLEFELGSRRERAIADNLEVSPGSSIEVDSVTGAMMTKYFDPDPLGMGLLATFDCMSCGRDRYADVTSTKEEDVLTVGEAIVQLPHASCPCGETRIRAGWSSADCYGFPDHEFEASQRRPGESAPPSPTRDSFWDTPTAPLPEPLAHQFRQTAGGQQWEADFERMTLSVLRTGQLLMSEEPVLYDLRCGPDGQLRMRPNEESRKIMVANIQERLAVPLDDAAAGQLDRAKLAALRRGDWSTIPSPFAESMHERYRDFVRIYRPAELHRQCGESIGDEVVESRGGAANEVTVATGGGMPRSASRSS
jgi:hypothetical protein